MWHYFQDTVLKALRTTRIVALPPGIRFLVAETGVTTALAFRNGRLKLVVSWLIVSMTAEDC